MGLGPVRRGDEAGKRGDRRRRDGPVGSRRGRGSAAVEGDGRRPGSTRVADHGLSAFLPPEEDGPLHRRRYGGDASCRPRGRARSRDLRPYGPSRERPIRGRPHDRKKSSSLQPMQGQGLQEPRMPAVHRRGRRMPGESPPRGAAQEGR